MRNFVMSGCTLTALAAAAVKSGDLVVANAVFGVATGDAAIGQEFELDTSGGVYDLPKVAAEAWDFGQVLYYDAAAKKVTETQAANLKIGVAVNPKGEAANAPIGRVRLNKSF
ncbi:DUF2190 family protein [Methylobacterium sp. CCH5-D2]|uniref:DUF2190 family protein n=1 Tax=Methylobacterium sp. CCH5-D2 TaxID=1768765 RepID=UPI00082B2815|nr:DUF2190 family protein [Methylobacterium sp. CCH5-D2]